MPEYRYPPIDWLWLDYWRAAAWYSGDAQKLRMYASNACGAFWASDEQIKVHVPIAADIASMSAGLIFSENPTITVEDEVTQARLDDILDEVNFYSTLLQAAEIASVYGGVFLKLSWDDRDTCPRIYAVPADAGLPVWRNGQLYSVTLWSIVREDRDTGAIYRLEEKYTQDGRIVSRLLCGSENDLGNEVKLTLLEETASILPEVNSGTGEMLAWYVPNILPNHSHPYLNFGRSDFDGLYSLFDSLDEAYSAMQRETRFTKTTVIVPAEYLRRKDEIFPALDNTSKPAQWTFSNTTGAFTALDIDSDNTTAPITVVNPTIHAESRAAVCNELVRRIFMMAGYAPQSAGIDISGYGESGTALAMREKKSQRTTETKRTYWWHAIKSIVAVVLKLDALVYHSGVDPNTEITVEMSANTQSDLIQMAEILEQLERAGAVSVDTKVRLLHPDWGEEKVLEEVQRIQTERGYVGAGPLDDVLGDTETAPPVEAEETEAEAPEGEAE